MFVLHANKNQLTLRDREPVTSGSVNVYRARFTFSPDWDGLTRTAVFRAGAVSRSVLLDDSGECTIPWEVLERPAWLSAGVYGKVGEDVVLPTIWANLGTIHEGAVPGEDARPPTPTPELWRQELARKGDRLDYTEDGDLGLYAGDKLLNSVPVAGGGEGGTSDHRLLTHRDAEGQHPIEAIEGLKAALERIPRPMTAEELRKILMNGDAAHV